VYSTRPEKGTFPRMEEQQIQNFVHRVSNDETLRKELAIDPNTVIMREGFSPRVVRIVDRLVPHLAMNQQLGPPFSWWI
jgi:hypothetical protein